jgi:YVTN family beta-propeller protein
VANYGSSTVSVIDTSNNTVVATIPIGYGPRGVAINPTNGLVYVANYGSNTASVISTVS